jgi:hypothetical protein
MRLQEFVDSMTGIATEKVSPGQGKSIRIPASIFHFTQGEDLQKILPPFTIARKKKRIIDEQTMQHIEENKLALLSEAAGKKIEPKLGLGLKVPGAMPLSSTPSAVRGLPIVESRSLKQQGPRYGSQACCGKGCNGCLVFWNDRRFEGGAIDLLIEFNCGRLKFFLPVECKRGYVANKRWVFFEEEDPPQSKFHYYFENKELRINFADSFTKLGIPVCLEGIEIDISKENPYKAGSLSSIYEIGNQVSKELLGFLKQELDERNKKASAGHAQN